MIRGLLLIITLATSGIAAGEPLRVAVAANFRATLEQINQAYIAGGGSNVVLSSASTGVLATQIRHGAPFDLFFSADEPTVAALEAESLGGQSQCYALGQLALVGGDLDDLDDPGKTLAIANPETAPYGRAAAEVLARTELASATDRQLIRGASVLQAFQFWRAGAVDLALVARSQAPQAPPVPVAWHQPLRQHVLVLRDSPDARAYLRWLGSDTVRQMIITAGYLPCP